MFMSPLHASALAASLLCCAAAQAQTAKAAARPDPLDAKASVPALSYESSFAQYRRLSDEKLISWREANDTVTRIGGWRVYAREAQQPEPAGSAPAAMSMPMRAPSAVSAAPAASAATPNPTPKPSAHDGHKMP